MIALTLRSPVFWMRLVGLVLVASVGLSLAHLTWRAVGWDDGRTQVWTPTALAPVGGGQGGGLTAILAWNPFGGMATGGDGLPESSLGLVLRGVIYAPGGGSTALISTGDGATQAFGVGEAPVGNAVIEAIEPERVVLNVGGRREALTLPKAAASGGAPNAVPPAASGAAPAAPGQAVQPGAAQPGAAPTVFQPAPSAPAASAVPAAAPSVVARTPQGYVVGPDAPAQLLRAGLRQGDVVRSVDGTTLGDPQTDRRILEQVAADGEVVVELLRDGRPLTLTVSLR